MSETLFVEDLNLGFRIFKRKHVVDGRSLKEIRLETCMPDRSVKTRTDDEITSEIFQPLQEFYLKCSSKNKFFFIAIDLCNGNFNNAAFVTRCLAFFYKNREVTMQCCLCSIFKSNPGGADWIIKLILALYTPTRPIYYENGPSVEFLEVVKRNEDDICKNMSWCTS